MKVRTECAHGMFDKHQINRQVGEGIVLEILCDGGTELNLEPVRPGGIADIIEHEGNVWLEHESEDS